MDAKNRRVARVGWPLFLILIFFKLNSVEHLLGKNILSECLESGRVQLEWGLLQIFSSNSDNEGSGWSQCISQISNWVNSQSPNLEELPKDSNGSN